MERFEQETQVANSVQNRRLTSSCDASEPVNESASVFWKRRDVITGTIVAIFLLVAFLLDPDSLKPRPIVCPKCRTEFPRNASGKEFPRYPNCGWNSAEGLGGG